MACETVMGFSVDKIGSHLLPTCAQIAKGIWCGAKEPFPVCVDTGMRCCWTMQQRTSFSLHPSPWLFPPLLEYSASLVPITYSLHPSSSILITSNALHPLWCLLLTPGVYTGPTLSMSPVFLAYIFSSYLLVSGLILKGWSLFLPSCSVTVRLFCHV